MKKNIIFTVVLLTLVISVFAVTSVQVLGLTDALTITVYTNSGYIADDPDEIPLYFAETETSGAMPPTTHYAYAYIYKDGVQVGYDQGRLNATSSHAYATYQPAMPNENFTTDHGYIVFNELQ